MGMASSQCRLLMLTSRIHDVEHKAMSIQNEKLVLATQSDEVSRKFLEALDAYDLTITGNVNGAQTDPIVATFNNMVGINALDTGTRKILKENDSNKIIVSEDVAEAYAKYKGNSAEEFAMIMLDENAYDPERRKNSENKIFDLYKDSPRKSDEQLVALREKMDSILYDNGVTTPDKLPDDVKKEYNDLEKAFNTNLYRNHGNEVMGDIVGEDPEEISNKDIKFYADLFNSIKQAGGCKSIEDYNVLEHNAGRASDNSQLLSNLVNSGIVGIYSLVEDENGNVKEMATSPSTDSNITNKPRTSMDKTDLAKAQAEYDRDTKKIDNIDKKYDQELSKLETERSALTTEYDSIKKVINDNIERTFGIFS